MPSASSVTPAVAGARFHRSASVLTTGQKYRSAVSPRIQNTSATTRHMTATDVTRAPRMRMHARRTR